MNAEVSDGYRRWVAIEARGSSALYEQWALGVAESDILTSLIAELPKAKRQPNLVFAAARWAGIALSPFAEIEAEFIRRWDDIATVARERATQTNEAARCAVLLPVLSRLPQPLALIEAGASAGLCLLPDRYSYRYVSDGEDFRLDPVDGPSEVEIECRINRESIPTRMPEIVWRAGIDLNPIDVRDVEQIRWLEALIWPGHEPRAARLIAASKVAASDPPQLVTGDIIEALPALIDAAPREATIVVFHSAVLAYLDREARTRFIELVRSYPHVVWVSNEAATVLASPASVAEYDWGAFCDSVDGEPVARVHPHGIEYEASVPVGRGTAARHARDPGRI